MIVLYNDKAFLHLLNITVPAALYFKVVPPVLNTFKIQHVPLHQAHKWVLFYLYYNQD